MAFGLQSSLESQSYGWTRIPIQNVEGLTDAVLGAGLQVMQMSLAPVTGSLAFATFDDGITCTSGSINGRVALNGPLSTNMVTLGVGIVMAPGTRHWLNEVESGSVGVFMPGDEHDALYAPGSMYAVVTLPVERLETIAAQDDLVLDVKTLGGTGIDIKKKLSEPDLFKVRKQFARVHAASPCAAFDAHIIGRQLLHAMILHFARPPHFHVGGADPQGHARIVARARAFIHANLDQPLSIDKIAGAAATSHRTLHRVFLQVLDETPYSYVQKLRLHRIRHDIISEAEVACTITTLAHRWGLPELGRFAAWYRELFGELPSETQSRHQTQHAAATRKSTPAVWQFPHSPASGAAVSFLQLDERS